jgi:hypothetical protein
MVDISSDGLRSTFGQTAPTALARIVVIAPAAIVLIHRGRAAVSTWTSLSGWQALHAIHLDAFQLLAWGVAFYLLCRLPAATEINRRDIFGAIAVGILGTFSSSLGLAALSAWLFAASGNDAHRRAVATIFAALFAHQVIVPILYGLTVDAVTRFDGMLVGSAIKLTIAGATWRDNIITVPSGHAIEILEACCSFHNVSMSVLSWLALTKLERPEWRLADLSVLAATAGFQILFNTLRLYLMAQSFGMYDYWHNGTGAGIYSVGASAAAVLISAFGAQLVTARGRRNRPGRLQIEHAALNGRANP